jgi:NAD(P)-dependent dehydrogenase (short-subunit alcohol dehydrogenase family)
VQNFAREESMAKRFDGKSILVSGAASGIGRATALAFGAEGGRLTVVDRSDKDGEVTAKMIRDGGGAAIFVKADVSKAADCRRMVEAAVEAHGGLHAAFNNAGIERHGYFTADVEEAAWNEVVAVNLTGVFLAMKHEIPAMLKNGGGAIVNTSSVGGVIGNPGLLRGETWRHRADQGGGFGICCARYPHQCGLSRRHSDADAQELLPGARRRRACQGAASDRALG